MVQWVRNPTVAAWVTTEVWVHSQASHSRLGDLALLQLQCRTWLWLGFKSLAQELTYAMGVAIKKKKKAYSIDIRVICLGRMRGTQLRRGHKPLDFKTHQIQAR